MEQAITMSRYASVLVYCTCATAIWGAESTTIGQHSRSCGRIDTINRIRVQLETCCKRQKNSPAALVDGSVQFFSVLQRLPRPPSACFHEVAGRMPRFQEL